MFVFLDESYNLSDHDKRRFISINGFWVENEKYLIKKWKEYRRPFTSKKRRIHAKDNYFDELRPKVLSLAGKRTDLQLLSVFQVVQEIPFGRDKAYFDKGKLNFDQVYLDLVVALLNELKLKEKENLTITIDSRQQKGGLLGQENFIQELGMFLKQKYKENQTNVSFQPSTTNILLELADFISNIFYRAYIEEDEHFFADWGDKLLKIENPL